MVTLFHLPCDVLEIIATYLCKESIFTIPYLLNQDIANIAQVSKCGNKYVKSVLLPILKEKYKKPSMDHVSLQILNNVLNSFDVINFKNKGLAIKALENLLGVSCDYPNK